MHTILFRLLSTLPRILLAITAGLCSKPLYGSGTNDPRIERRTSIEVKVTGIKSTNGKLLINLYNSKEGFPAKPELALRNASISPTRADHSKYIFKSLTPGNYAIAVCHDENNNGTCDSNFLGIPKEGVGVSKNAKGVMGPPKFRKAMIELNESEKEVNISLMY